MSVVFRVPEERILDDLAMTDLPSWDSLSHMNLILEIERQYDVQLSGDEIADMQSVPRILEILSRHLPRQHC
jgi:acyl carrier protein